MASDMDRVDGFPPPPAPFGGGDGDGPLVTERRVAGSLAAAFLDHPELSNEEALTAILRDREHIQPPPPPGAGSRINPFGGPRIPTPPPQARLDFDDASGSDHDTEDEDDSADEPAEAPRRGWQGKEEDKSEPCQDELEYIAAHEEHSALEHTHWEKKTFFELDDPELVPGDAGRIDWLVEKFNGTKEDPNTERIMRSPVVRIGGLDWQIKFYPRGNRCDYLSAYIECVSMLSPHYAESQDFEDPPFPFLKNADRVRKRRSIAAQFSVIMYNPAEPRVYEFMTEAHQFHKKGADYGWKYFSNQPHYDFHARQHKQRQAILRDDRLAFTAYIRIVHEPSGCIWEHEPARSLPDHFASITGLRPFTKSMQYVAAGIILLHFKPFRQYVHSLHEKSFAANWLQHLLLKMYTRKKSASYGSRGSLADCDVMEMLWRFSAAIAQESKEDEARPSLLEDLVGVFHAEKGTPCGSSRLNTKDYTSIQEAVKHHTKTIACPALLTLELQRQEHNKKDRKWKKLTNKVEVQDHIKVGGHKYTLFAFVTHSGHLQSNQYNPYVRPRGVGSGWYAYQDGRVTRLTEQQARVKHSGCEPSKLGSRTRSPEDGYDSPYLEHHEPATEVSCAVMYVREDHTEQAFAPCIEENWVPPFLSKAALANPPEAAVNEESTPNPQAPAACQEAAPLVSPASIDDMTALVIEAAGASTPEPEPLLMDGDDVVMREADDDSNYTIEIPETDEAENAGDLEKEGTVDWLGRPYYHGQYKDKKFHGDGHHINVNGDEYLGSFKNGVYSGYGKMIFSATGDVYEGDWVDGQHHGRGKMTECSTGNVFEGGWKDGKKHGDFVLRGTVTDEDRNCCTICYDKEISTAFFDCGHVIACRDCAARIDTCPVCRKRVAHRIQLYGVKISLS